MRKKWITYHNNVLGIETNSGQSHPHYIGELAPECEDLRCYDVFDNGDGTYTALLSEVRYADMMNKKAKEQYALLKQN